jgi:hypothetical protein
LKAPRKKSVRGSAKKKPGKKTKQAKPAKAKPTLKRAETRKLEASIPIQPVVRVLPSARENVRITVENIRGETAIGDLLVAFPRTREVLARNGLRLEAENAGDIYMTLDAFSALNGLRTESLVQDLVVIAKEPPVQQSVPQLAVAPPF